MTQARQDKLSWLLYNRAFHQQVKDANIIFGVDESTETTFVVFGFGLCTRIIKSGTPEQANILVVHLLEQTTELEALISVVRTLKGYDDYCSSKSADAEVDGVSPTSSNVRIRPR